MPYETSTPNSPEAQSASPIHDNLEALQRLFPSIVRDGQVDVDALRQLVGEALVKDNELFGLNWKGKAEARRAALTPSLGTLRPAKDESVDWDNTKNLYIEGDNLEVLKLLRKSYGGKVKMIYIDPPYNTGSDFVYPDDYQASIANYLQITKQASSFRANQETSGRFHTTWLNMMLPRIILARDLLCDNGVLMLSIDDKEVQNAKIILQEIFGDDNCLGMLIHQRAKGGGNAKNIVKGHDYIIICCKNSASVILRRKNKNIKDTMMINDVECVINDDVVRKRFGKYDRTEGDRRCSYEELTKYKTKQQIEIIEQKIREGRYILKEGANGQHIICECIPVDESYKKTYSIIKFLSEKGVSDLEELGIRGFDYPKPTDLITYLIENANINDGDIVMDFFSGSATTAHALLRIAAEGVRGRFILVQLPEFLKKSSLATEFLDEIKKPHNICEIGKERIRRAGASIKADYPEVDVGFRVFKLDSSNVKVWNPQPENLLTAMESYGEHLVSGRTSDDFLAEIMLKSGIDLCEDAEEKDIAGHTVYSLGCGQYYACMDATLAVDYEEVALGISEWHASEAVEAGGEQKDTCTVFVLDKAFSGKDDLKMNFVAILEQHGIVNVKAL